MGALMTYIQIAILQILSLETITIRAVLTARNEKLFNTILSVVQAYVSIYGSGLVIIGEGNLIVRIIVFAISCGIGCYLGMVTDEKFALGTNMVTVICNKDEMQRIATMIREKGFALTSLDAKSKDKNKSLLMIALKRKNEKKLMNEILKDEKDIMIIDESVNTVGGYFK